MNSEPFISTFSKHYYRPNLCGNNILRHIGGFDIIKRHYFVVNMLKMDIFLTDCNQFEGIWNTRFFAVSGSKEKRIT